jgi:tetratricopeptide (TPR) repeat protein
MLETVREFALERLEESDRADEIRRRHAHYFVELATNADARLASAADDDQALTLFEREQGNIRAALGFLIGYDSTQAIELAAACGWFWFLRGHFSEGRAWLEQSLRAPDYVAPALRAKVFMRRGALAEAQGDLEEAERSWRTALELRRELHDLEGISAALNNLGNLDLRIGNYPDARRAYEEALALARETIDPSGCASALCNLGIVCFLEGDLNRAEALLSESLVLVEESGNRYGEAIVLQMLGTVAVDRNELDRARDLLGTSLRLTVEIDQPAGVAGLLEELALVAAKAGDPAAGARALGAAEAVRNRLGAHGPDPGDRRGAATEAVRARLDADALSRAWADGAAMAPDEAADYALAVIAAVSSPNV